MRTAKIKGYYGMLQRDVMRMKEVGPLSKLVYCLLVSYAAQNERCFPSILCICEDLDLSKPTVIKAIKELEDKSLLLVYKVPSKSGYKSNLYEPLYLVEDNSQVKEIDLGSKPDLLSLVNDVYPIEYNTLRNNSNNNTSTNSEELGEIETDNSSSTVKAKKEKTSKKKVSKLSDYSPDQATEIYGQCKEAFLTLYLEEHKTEYYWEPLNGAKMYSLLRKILFKMKEREDRLYGMTELVDATSVFFRVAYATADNWLQSNFNLSNVDSKFNDIYSKIKAGKHGNQQRKSVAEATRESVRNAFN